MTDLRASIVAPLVVAGIVFLLTAAPVYALGRRPTLSTITLWGLLLLALVAPWAPVAYLSTGAGSAMLAIRAWPGARAGAVMLSLATVTTVAAAGWLALRDADAAALGLSLIAIALRSGVAGVHAGVASLSRQAVGVQATQYATLLVLVFVHLRFVDHVPAASAIAPAVVLVGAVSALGFALTSLVQRDLGGLLQGSTLVHGGFLVAAVGAAGRGHHVAALFVALTMAMALSGLTLMVVALEARVGPVSLATPGGRARALPRLAAAFAFFGAAGVGMPGTAGFIADDLLLHALWEESVVATVAVVFASALLAIATLRAITAAFFGAPARLAAPDLLPRERRMALGLMALLLAVGLSPQALVAASRTLFSP